MSRPSARGAPSSFSACSRTSSGMPASSILRAVLVGDRALVLAQLLADRVHLLAQEVLALLALGALTARRRGSAGGPGARPAARAEARARARAARSRRASRAGRPCRAGSGRASSPEVSASGPGSVIERRKARMRSSAPRRSRISSTTARYSRSSVARRARRRARRPRGTVDLDAQRARRVGVRRRRAMPRATPWTASTAVPPPGMRMRSTTSATVPTPANSPSVRGTSRTRSSSPASTASVAVMPGKTIESSSGMRIKFSIARLFPLRVAEKAGSRNDYSHQRFVSHHGLWLTWPLCRQAPHQSRTGTASATGPGAADSRGCPAWPATGSARPSRRWRCGPTSSPS